MSMHTRHNKPHKKRSLRDDFYAEGNTRKRNLQMTAATAFMHWSIGQSKRINKDEIARAICKHKERKKMKSSIIFFSPLQLSFFAAAHLPL